MGESVPKVEDLLDEANLEALLVEAGQVAESDLDGLAFAQLNKIFLYELDRFRALLHDWQFKAAKAKELCAESTALYKEVRDREEKLRERERKLEDGRFLAEYRESAISEAQQVYRVEVVAPAPALDYSRVERAAAPARPPPRNQERERSDGIVTPVKVPANQVLQRLRRNIVILRKMCVIYEKRFAEMEESIRRITKNIEEVKEQERCLHHRELAIEERERAALVESLGHSCEGA